MRMNFNLESLRVHSTYIIHYTLWLDLRYVATNQGISEFQIEQI